MAIYCSECGTEMIEKEVGAEEYPIFMPDFPIHVPHHPPYDSKTGKKQYLKEYICPKKRWWNSHDQYALGETYTK